MTIGAKTFAIVFLLACCTVSQNCDTYDTSNCDNLFNDWKNRHGITYETDQQNSKRKELICKRAQEINAWNCEEQNSYRKALNKKSAFTQQQWAKLKDLQQKPATQRVNSGIGKHIRVTNPTTLDWRNNNGNYVTSIKDQGTCGSCWTFGGAAYSESKLIIDELYDTNLDLSEQYLLECTRDSTCNGGYIEYVMQEITAQGIPTESSYPYQPYSSYDGICNAQGIGVANTNTDQYNLSDDQMKTLLQVGPLHIAVSADNWDSYSTGTFSCAVNSTINHAVLLIGYTQTAWIIKNEWGTSWGDQGYIYVTTDSSTNCQIGSGVHTLSGNTLRFSLYALILIILSIIV